MSRPTKQSLRHHEPLRPGDTEQQTVGCRHSNPEICAKNSLADVCAFVRVDGICLSPPLKWPQQFQRLRAKREPST